jgi:hypothetical protein
MFRNQWQLQRRLGSFCLEDNLLILFSVLQHSFIIWSISHDFPGQSWTARPQDVAKPLVLQACESIPVRGRGGPNCCETCRLPNFLEYRVTDGGEDISFMRRPPFTPKKTPGTHFCSRLSRAQGRSATGWIRLIEETYT